MHGNFYVLLICPRCHRSKWLYLEGIESTAADLLNTHWDFPCPIHGSQHEKPLQVNETSPCLINSTKPPKLWFPRNLQCRARFFPRR